MKPAIGLHQAMQDPNLFGATFGASSFWTWRTVAKIIDGIPLREQRERDLFFRCTGRTKLPTGPVRRLFILVGRRGGKDRFMSSAAIWRAALCANWHKHISAGEGAVSILLGGDKRQAGILSRYCGGLIASPMLAAEVKRHIKDTLEFRNGGSLETTTNSTALVRGRSAIGIFGSEVSFWRTAEYNAGSDEEVLSSAEPSMAMCPDGGVTIMASSVYRKRGLMHRMWKELFGNDDSEDICWFAPSQVMNEKIPDFIIERAMASNPARAKAEYLNVWREDLSDLIPEDVILSCTDRGIYERPPIAHTQYYAHADAAGGTGNDSFAFAISHRSNKYIIDCVREYKPRFTPATVIAELAALCRTYGVTQVRGDRYAIGFHSSEWKSHGIEFLPTELSTSDIYLTLLPLLLANRVSLLDNKTVRQQLGSLERRPSDSGKETVTHPQHDSAHDDTAAAVAGAIVAALVPTEGYTLETLQRANSTEETDPQIRQRYINVDATSAAAIPWDLRRQFEREKAARETAIRREPVPP